MSLNHWQTQVSGTKKENGCLDMDRMVGNIIPHKPTLSAEKVNSYRCCWSSRAPLGHYGSRDSLDPTMHLLWAVRLKEKHKHIWFFNIYSCHKLFTLFTNYYFNAWFIYTNSFTLPVLFLLEPRRKRTWTHVSVWTFITVVWGTGGCTIVRNCSEIPFVFASEKQLLTHSTLKYKKHIKTKMNRTILTWI